MNCKNKKTGGRNANPDIVGMTNKNHIATGDCTSIKYRNETGENMLQG